MQEILIGNIKEKGNDGVSVTDAVVNEEGHLIISLSNNTTIDAGTVNLGDKFVPEDYALPILYFDGDVSGMDKDNAVDLQYRYRFKDESEKDESEKVKYKSGTASVKWQGSSSINYPKKNYTVKFDQAFEPVKGWGAHNKYCMKANWIDFSHARNVVSAKLWGKMCRGTRKEQEQFEDLLTAGLPNCGAIDGFPIVIVINGEYMGLYSFCIPKDAWMFGLDENDVNHCIIGAGGYNTQTAFKAMPYIVEDIKKDPSGHFEWEYISDAATDEDKARFQESLQNLFTELNAVSSKEDLYKLTNITNIEFFIQYYVYVALLSAYDCITKNYLLFTVDGTKWQISAYDLDSTFGLETDGASFFNVNHKSYAKLAESNMLFRKIYDYAKDRLKAWHNQFVSTNIGNRYVTQEFYNYCKDIPKVYFDEEIKRWTSLPSTNTSNLDQITNYYRLRLEFLQSEVDSW